MTYSPTRDRVIIKKLPSTERQSPIILPDGGEKSPTLLGEIVAIGPLVRQVQAGDHVYFVETDFEPIGDLLIGPEDYLLAKAQ